MRFTLRLLLFIGLNCSFAVDSENENVESDVKNEAENEYDVQNVNSYTSDKKKIQNLREALLAFDDDSLQKLLNNPNLTTADFTTNPSTTTPVLTTPLPPRPSINNELIDIVKDDTIGNFDQITIERDDEGAIVVTKTKRVFADGRQHTHKITSTAADFASKADGPQLKNVAQILNQTEIFDLVQKNEPESETDQNAFIQNEQLITICLAALGVTSTGLLMWIAIQHLYGIYTDFKKTINPMSYHDSNYSEEYECTSVISARMADRPPSYDHSQEAHPYMQRQAHPTYQRDMQRHSMPAPPYMGPSTSQDHQYDTGSLDLNTQQQMSFNGHGTPQCQTEYQEQYQESDTSSWESEDERMHQMPNSLNQPPDCLNTYHTQVGHSRRAVSLGNSDIDDEDAQLQRRFALRRRMERFRRQRRQSPGNAINCNTIDIEEEVCEEPPFQVVHVPNFRSFSQPSRHSLYLEPEPPEEIDRISTNSAPVEHDFESAPELAELDILHHILQQSNSRTQPRRTTSFASYVDCKVAPNGSIVFIKNVQIEIDGPSSTTCRVEEINE